MVITVREKDTGETIQSFNEWKDLLEFLGSYTENTDWADQASLADVINLEESLNFDIDINASVVE